MIVDLLLLLCGLVLVGYGVSVLAPARTTAAVDALRRAAGSPTAQPRLVPVPAPEVATLARSDATPWTATRILFLAAVGVIVAGALVIRAVDLTGSPPGFYVDEVSNALDSYLIAHTGRDQHGVLLPTFFEALGDWRGSLYIYWNVPFVLAFGMTEFAIRFGSAVMGTLTVLLVYLFVSKAVNRWVGLISAFLLATAPWHIMQSRIGWDILTVPFLTALCLTFLFYGLERPRLLPLAFVAGALGMYGYFSGRLFFPLFCLLWMAIYWRDLWRLRRYTDTGIALAVVIVIPAVISIANGTLSARFSQVQGPPQSLGTQLATFLYNYWAHFQASFLFDSSTYWITRLYVRGFGMLYGIEIPFLILGLTAMILRRRRTDLLFLGWLLIYPIPAALAGQPFSTRSIPGVIVFQIAVAEGVYLVVRYGPLAVRMWAEAIRARILSVPSAQRRAVLHFVSRTANSEWRKASVALAVILAGAGLLSTASFVNADLNEYPLYSAGWAGWQAGPDQIVAYLERERGRYDHLLMTADFNAPDELMQFYSMSYPDQCASCSIVNMDDPQGVGANYLPGVRELWAVTPIQLQSSQLATVPHRVVGHLTYPDGETSFVFVATGPGIKKSQAG